MKPKSIKTIVTTFSIFEVTPDQFKSIKNN